MNRADLHSTIDVSQHRRYKRAADYEAEHEARTDVTSQHFADEPRTYRVHINTTPI